MRRTAASSLRASRRHALRPCPHSTRSRHTDSHLGTTVTQADDPLVQITTLPNGIRVATESTPGHFSSLGLYVDAGCRYETSSNLGVSHFIDRMAFKTTHHRSSDQITQDIDSLGGQIICSSARESIMYQSSHFNQGTPLALNLIADTVLNSAFLPEELDAQREAARYELREVSSKPEMILPEILHEVAYGNQDLGNPLLCPENRIDLIDGKMMREFMQERYSPGRMVFAGAGMPHEELVQLVQKHFPISAPSIDAARSTLISPKVPSHLLMSSQTSTPIFNKLSTRSQSSFMSSTPSLPKSTYTGGHHFIYDSNSEFNHLYLAYEGAGIHGDDVYATAVLQMLLGGGGSFSAGGPGKGMYSRLYTWILNRLPQVDHCASFHHIYANSSLFGLFASFHPKMGRQVNNPSNLLPHLVHQLSLFLYDPASRFAEDLPRAKNQLKSSLMMSLESRAVGVEDLGRQILMLGRKVPVQEMCDKIDAVDHPTLVRIANRLFGPHSGAKPTVLVMGRQDVGDYASVLQKYGVSAG
ncbi:Metalloenzyme, LuxS/M16 peptidase-like protein [Epithele typhae]|uniref:Metalloenzyme, LuxS/M16 peptidase-like protein n=1 Tax=Epithele typhae TaxID=378194 RepID=UPI002007847E|nr:Metalloenzyme, LuxS/M16 peptidase-like protein [Epithele typhae]KAH9932027.1 Metalloenzyme, LuxS/M16 peptidase-like protein [Epithele typhae]